MERIWSRYRYLGFLPFLDSVGRSFSSYTRPPGTLILYKMASGVKVAEEVKIKYDDIKKKKSYRYIVFYIKDEKMITVEKIGERNSNYSDFLQDLTGSGPDDCRY